MATVKTSFRLPEQALQAIDYLTFFARQSEAGVVAEWMGLVREAVQRVSVEKDPSIAGDPRYLCNGGSLLSVAEQEAVKHVREVLRQLR